LMRRVRLNLVFLFGGAALVCVNLLAQYPKVAPKKPGSLSGDVVSAKGTPVAGAQVMWQAADGGTPHVLHSDARGHFRLEPLRAGLYELRASVGGAWSEWEQNVIVRPGAETAVTLKLSFKTPSVAVAVELKGTMRTWDISVPGAAPRDATVDPQGNAWFTFPATGHIARFNPDTHEWKIFKVPGADSGPDGLLADANGNIWFAENTAGKIAKWNAGSGEITEFTPFSAKDPHTLVFGPDGGLWFTSPNRNLIGRLDVQSGKIDEFSVPTQGGHPDGIISAGDGALWFCESAGQKIARVDPVTEAITEFIPPDAGVHPRRLVAVGAAIYFTDSDGGRLGRFTPADKKFKMWESPSGKDSQPYGIASDSTGKIWYEESAASANKLVRFDPSYEVFTVYSMPADNSSLGNIVRDARGHLWMPLSAPNKIASVE
jgi:virginiamycin B lyase